MTFEAWARRLDARYMIPRRPSDQHLSSGRALLAFAGTLARGAVAVFAGTASAALVVWAAVMLGASPVWLAVAAIAAVMAIAVGCGEASSLAIVYSRVAARETFGAARWATTADLEAAGLLDVGRSESSAIKVGEWRMGRPVVLPLERMLTHVAIFGPPGSGKSKSFLIPIVRQWLEFGSVFAVDPKHELYAYTASHARHVFRLDLEDALKSDRLDLVSPCARSRDVAHEIASLIVSYDEAFRTSRDPFWPKAELALVAALLMYAAEEDEKHRARGIPPKASPAFLRELLAEFPGPALGRLLESRGSRAVCEEWRLFAEAKRDTQGSIRIGLSTTLAEFATPAVYGLFRPPSEAERDAGVRSFDLRMLRRPGTAAYLVISEGTASRLRATLATVIGAVQAYLRASGNERDAVPALVAIDEAGNVPVPNLSERLGVGRGLGTSYVLGYQGLAQARAQMGRDWSTAMLASIGTQIFLGGLDEDTAGYVAARCGRVTAISRQSTDGVGTRYDNTRESEVARDLIAAADVRQLLPHVEALVITRTDPPVRMTIPRLELGAPSHEPRFARVVPDEAELAPAPGIVPVVDPLPDRGADDEVVHVMVWPAIEEAEEETEELAAPPDLSETLAEVARSAALRGELLVPHADASRPEARTSSKAAAGRGGRADGRKRTGAKGPKQDTPQSGAGGRPGNARTARGDGRRGGTSGSAGASGEGDDPPEARDETASGAVERPPERVRRTGKSRLPSAYDNDLQPILGHGEGGFATPVRPAPSEERSR